MTQVKAIFDGERIVLPPHVRARHVIRTPVAVLVEFPSGVLDDLAGAVASTATDAWRPRSIWDIIDDDYQPKRSLDDALRELNEGRT